METEVLRVQDQEEAALARAGDVLRQGGIVAFPTDTVYGLGVLADNPAARQRLRRLKERENEKPFQLLIGDLGEVKRLGIRTSPAAERLMRRFWPGALTLVLPDGQGGTVGLRLPELALTRKLLRAAGGPLAATSANRTKAPPAADAEAILAEFAGAIELILDNGASRRGLASTVVRVAGDKIDILREGAISAAEINASRQDEQQEDQKSHEQL